MRRKTMTTEMPQISAVETLALLMQQHEVFGQHLATTLERVSAETENLLNEGKARAAELDETRGELVELRAALEIEKEKPAAAQARITRLEAHVRATRRSCDEVLNDVEPISRNRVADTDADPDPVTPVTPITVVMLAGLLGVSESALSELAAIKGATSLEEMLRIILVRELEEAGLRALDATEVVRQGEHGEEGRTAWS